MVTQVKHIRTSKLGRKFTAGKKKPKIYYWKYDKQTVNRTYGGSRAIVSVYKNTPNGLLKLGETEWDTRSMKGENSEVFTFLHEKGEIPEEIWNKYHGYYIWHMREDDGITIEEI